MPQVGLLIFLNCSIIFSLEAKQNYWFPATGMPVEVKRTVLESILDTRIDSTTVVESFYDSNWRPRKMGERIFMELCPTDCQTAQFFIPVHSLLY